MIYKIQNHVETWSSANTTKRGELKSRLSRPLSEVKGLTFEMCQSGKLTPEVEKAFLQGQIWCTETETIKNHGKKNGVSFFGGDLQKSVKLRDVKLQESKTWKLKVFLQLGENA